MGQGLGRAEIEGDRVWGELRQRGTGFGESINGVAESWERSDKGRQGLGTAQIERGGSRESSDGGRGPGRAQLEGDGV